MRLALVMALLGLVACSSGTSLNTLTPIHAVLDFGEVELGTSPVMDVPLLVNGPGQVQLEIDPTTVPAGIILDATALSPLHAGNAKTLHVTFAPEQPGRMEGTIVVKTRGASNGPLRIEVKGSARAHTSIAVDPGGCLDFGDVQLGQIRWGFIVISNLINANVSIAISTGDPSLSVNPSSLVLAPFGAQTVQVVFQPRSVGAIASKLQFACPDCQWVTHCVTGNGRPEDAFSLSPGVLDFGQVLDGTTRCDDVMVKNEGAEPLSISTAVPDSLFVRSGAFSLELGQLLDPGNSIASGATQPFSVCFRPTLSAPYHGAVALDSANGVEHVLQLMGSGVHDNIVPSAFWVDFGVVVHPVVRDIYLHNAGDPDDATIRSVVVDSPDVNVEFPDGDPQGFDVGRGDFRIRVTFDPASAGEHALNLLVSLDGSTTAPCTIPITRDAGAGPPMRHPLSFGGSLRAGARAHEPDPPGPGGEPRCGQTTSTPVWNPAIDPIDAPFSVSGVPAGVISIIHPGGSAYLTVKYKAASSFSVDTAALTFHDLGMSGSDVIRSISLSGLGSGLEFRVSPEAIDFGTIPTGSVKHLAVSLFNEGRTTETIGSGQPSDIGLVGAFSSPAFSVTHLDRVTPIALPAASQLSFEVSFAPTAPGLASGEMAIWLQNIPEPIRVPVTGTADGVCGAGCNQASALCQPNVQTWSQMTASVWGAGDAAGGGPITCLWETLDAPQGSAPVLDGASCDTHFLPDLAGNYTLSLTVTDKGGRTDSCQTQVTAVDYPGLMIQSTWSAPDDVDLHLFHPLAGDIRVPASWFNLPYDCWAQNPFPNWDTGGGSEDCRFQVDDQTGQGPEVIQLEEPATDHSYDVGVHWYASEHRNAEEDVTTRVVCAGKLAAQVQSHLDQVYMAAHVGRVTWQADGCSFAEGGESILVPP